MKLIRIQPKNFLSSRVFFMISYTIWYCYNVYINIISIVKGVATLGHVIDNAAQIYDMSKLYKNII